MDLLRRDELEKLVEEPRRVCVSIFLPTHRAGTEIQQDPIRLKNLLREAEERLVARGLRAAEIEALLGPARELVYDDVFWRYQSDGLAVFISPGAFRFYRLPLRFEELALVADRYHLKPLLPLLTEDGQFYVLALSQNDIRLLQATRHAVDDIELPDLPESFASAPKRDDPEKQRERPPRGPGTGRRHAHHRRPEPGEPPARPSQGAILKRGRRNQSTPWLVKPGGKDNRTKTANKEVLRWIYCGL